MTAQAVPVRDKAPAREKDRVLIFDTTMRDVATRRRPCNMEPL